MRQQELKVLVAAESPNVRWMLSDLASAEPGVAVVGQAGNSAKAIDLARRLRPDVALVDCCLPHGLGIDSVRLSRIGGLDTALFISEEVQVTRAIVLVNLDHATFQEEDPTLTRRVCLCREEGTRTVTFSLQRLSQEASPPKGLVFADLRMMERAPARNKVMEIAEGVMIISSLALMGGLGLIATFVLAPAGAALALAGLGGLFLGLATQVAATVWLRLRGPLSQRSARQEKSDV